MPHDSIKLSHCVHCGRPIPKYSQRKKRCSYFCRHEKRALEKQAEANHVRYARTGRHRSPHTDGIVLKYKEGMTQTAIAEHFGMKVGNINRILQRELGMAEMIKIHQRNRKQKQERLIAAYSVK